VRQRFRWKLVIIAALAGLVIAWIGLLADRDPGSESLRRFLFTVGFFDPRDVIRVSVVVLLGAGVAALTVWYLGYRRQQAFTYEYWSLEKRLRQAQSRQWLEREALPGDVVDAVPPMMPDVPPVPELPEELIRACAEGEGVLYAGLGIGAQAGLPTWREALEVIIRRADEGKLWGDQALKAPLTQRSSPVRSGLRSMPAS
jgi:hypothetical protein